MPLDWIQHLEAKRDACYSTTVVVETNDDRRPQEYLTYRREQNQETMVWDTFEGLTLQTPEGIRKMDGGGGFGSDDVEAVKSYLKEKEADPRKQKKRTVVIKNVLAAADLPMKALNAWAMDDGLMGQANSIVLFIPDRALVNSKVLDKCIFISPPYSTKEERKALLDSILEQIPVEGKINTDALVEATGGLNLAQTEAVFSEMVLDYALNKRKELAIQVISEAKADIINKSPGLKIKKDLKQGFERIGGYDPLKEYIIQNVVMPLKEPDKAKEIGMDLPRGMILFGPGGTGKTVFAKALAKEVGLPFCTLSPENFMNSFVGESERQLREIIKLAEEMAPIIIFIDEIDRLGGRGDGGESDGGTSKRLFSMLLEWLGNEDRKTYVIGATNAPYMDQAFRREGRFDCIVPMLSPDANAREAIIKVHLNIVRKVPHDITDKEITTIASMTEGWKGNMLEELVKRSVREAFIGGSPKVHFSHMSDAFKDYQVNSTALKQDEEKYISIAYELCNSKRFLAKLLGPSYQENNRMKAIREAKKQ